MFHLNTIKSGSQSRTVISLQLDDTRITRSCEEGMKTGWKGYEGEPNNMEHHRV